MGPYGGTSTSTSTASSSSAPHESPRSDDGGAMDGKRRYRCDVCWKRFSRPSSLKQHMRAHTGEKPFVCTVPGCDKKFSILSNLKRHYRIHGDNPPPLNIAEAVGQRMGDGMGDGMGGVGGVGGMDDHGGVVAVDGASPMDEEQAADDHDTEVEGDGEE